MIRRFPSRAYRIMLPKIHKRLIDAIQAGRTDDAYAYARLLAWYVGRFE